MDQMDDMTVGWDEETSTPYAYFNDNMGGLLSYDDERAICMKTEYAIMEDLHGFVSCIACFLSAPIIDHVTIMYPHVIFAVDYLGAFRGCHGRSLHAIA